MNLINSDADLLRDLALEFEQDEFYKAKRLMELALIARPTGPFIQQKVEEYRKLELVKDSIPSKKILNGKIFYQHIAKAGGTSINNYFSNVYAIDQVQTHIESLDVDNDSDRLKELKFISGHMRFFQANRILDLKNHYCISMIRHPLDHLVSHLKWVLKVSEDMHSAFFKRHPENIKALSLKIRSTDWKNFNEVNIFFQMDNLTVLNLFNNCQTRYFLSHNFGELKEKDFKEAIRCMDNFDLIGKLEYEDVFMQELSNDIKQDYKPLEKLNNNDSESFIDLSNPQIVNLLIAQIQYDIKLYNSFDKVFKRKTN